MGGQWSVGAIQGTAGSPGQEEAGEMVVGRQADRGHPGQRRTWTDIGDKHQRHYIFGVTQRFSKCGPRAPGACLRPRRESAGSKLFP